MPKLSAKEQRLIEIQDRIDAYLMGHMTKEEEHQFLSECKENEELREMAYITALLVKSLKANNIK